MSGARPWSQGIRGKLSYRANAVSADKKVHLVLDAVVETDAQPARVKRDNADELPPDTDTALVDFTQQRLLELRAVRSAMPLVRWDVLPFVVGLGFQFSCSTVAESCKNLAKQGTYDSLLTDAEGNARPGDGRSRHSSNGERRPASPAYAMCWVVSRCRCRFH